MSKRFGDHLDYILSPKSGQAHFDSHFEGDSSELSDSDESLELGELAPRLFLPSQQASGSDHGLPGETSTSSSSNITTSKNINGDSVNDTVLDIATNCSSQQTRLHAQLHSPVEPSSPELPTCNSSDAANTRSSVPFDELNLQNSSIDAQSDQQLQDLTDTNHLSGSVPNGTPNVSHKPHPLHGDLHVDGRSHSKVHFKEQPRRVGTRLVVTVHHTHKPELSTDADFKPLEVGTQIYKVAFWSDSMQFMVHTQ